MPVSRNKNKTKRLVCIIKGKQTEKEQAMAQSYFYINIKDYIAGAGEMA